MLWCRVIRLGWHGKAHTHNSRGSLSSPALGSRGASLSCLALLYDCSSQEIPHMHRPGLMPSNCCLWEQRPLFLPSSQGVGDPCRLCRGLCLGMTLILVLTLLWCFREAFKCWGEQSAAEVSPSSSGRKMCFPKQAFPGHSTSLWVWLFTEIPLSSLSWLTPSVKWAAFW